MDKNADSDSLVGSRPAPTPPYFLLVPSGLTCLLSPALCSFALHCSPGPGDFACTPSLSSSATQCWGLWQGFCREEACVCLRSPFFVRLTKKHKLGLRKLEWQVPSPGFEAPDSFQCFLQTIFSILLQIYGTLPLLFSFYLFTHVLVFSMESASLKCSYKAPYIFPKTIYPLTVSHEPKPWPQATSERTDHRLKLQPFGREEPLIWA